MSPSPACRACVVIPARMASSRLPGKMLLRDTGRSLIEHTHMAALHAERPSAVLVATDHEAILQEVRDFGGEAILTSPDHTSGTDRIAEVARQRPEFDLLVNLQGDEPEIDPASIDQVIALLENDPAAPMATLAAPIEEADLLNDPSNVKVVLDQSGKALYFSRSPIPFVRDASEAIPPGLFHHHVGLYAYRRDFLLRFAELPPSPLEQAERLEQLRALEAGATILVGQIPSAAPGIDTPGDYAAFVRRRRRRHAA